MKAKQKLSPVHPGEILYHDFLEPLGLTQTALARALGVTPIRINQIVRGQRSITADTSWCLAFKWRRDTHHAAAIPRFDQHPEADVLWTPWQRVEVFNSFRQAERTGLLRHGESRQIIRLFEQEVQLGYWPHVEFDWTDAVRTACELGAEHSLKLLMRAMDLFHVAVAIEAAADGFLSFDADQTALAESAGLPLIALVSR